MKETISVWCEHEQLRIERFRAWWLAQNGKRPNDFPLDMNPGEWDEQYLMWEGC